MSTLANFRTMIAAELGLGDGSTASADLTEIDRRVNEGVVDVLLRTGCKVQSGTQSLTAGTSDYELSTSILQIKDVYLTSASTSYRLEPVSPEDLIDMRVFESTTSSPAMYYAVNGSNLLMVYPTPAAADTLTTYYIPRPTALSSGSDTPSEIPAEFHPAVEMYALWRLASYNNDETSGQGERYRQMYDAEIKKIRRYVNTKGNVRLAPARLKRRPFVPNDPSVSIR